MASSIGVVLELLRSQIVTAGADLNVPLTACLKGMGGEARLPFARIVRGGGDYLMAAGMGNGDMTGELDKTYLIQIGFHGENYEQVDEAMELFESLWLKTSDTYYQALQALGGWALQPVSHSHPVLLQAAGPGANEFKSDSEQQGVLNLKLYLRRSYIT